MSLNINALFVAGFLVFVIGLGLWWLPLAFMVGGSILMAVAVVLEFGRRAEEKREHNP